MASFTIHNVREIRVTADSAPVEGQGMAYWQRLRFLDAEGRLLGEALLFLDGPDAALPVGDTPPYWGIDASQPLMVVDGQAPF